VDSVFGSIAAVYVWWDQLEVHIICCEEALEGAGCFVVQVLKLGVESCNAEAGMCTLVYGKNGFGTMAFEGHGQDSIAVIIM